MNVLVINSGSSSIKYKIINSVNKKVLSSGHVDGIGLDSCLLIKDGVSRSVFLESHSEALSLILEGVDRSLIDAVGHRFVHGGSMYVEPVIITGVVLDNLKKLVDLAPLHNPHNLEGIISCMNLLDVPQVAVFDTAFHSSIPVRASSYALPNKIVDEHNIKKYGFHGISHKYLMLEAKEMLGRESVNLITCHLGNGCSVSCIKRNLSIDTSMGFSPLQGLVMGSRSGDVDPGIILYLEDKLRLSSKDVCDLLNKKSGLKGLCGDSDVRKIYERVLSSDLEASRALDIFEYRLIQYIGAYLAIMGDETHALVFSGGVGEGAFYIRKKVALALKHLGVDIDFDKNMTSKGLIKKPTFINSESSKIKILVIPTNEELMIALEVEMLVREIKK